jgi:hypothetical protein
MAFKVSITIVVGIVANHQAKKTTVPTIKLIIIVVV